jgi:hypothetical protein
MSFNDILAVSQKTSSPQFVHPLQNSGSAISNARRNVLPSSALTLSKRVYGLVVLTSLASLLGLAGLGLWLLTPLRQGARLVRVTFLSISHLPCSSTLVVFGPALSFRAEWRIEADVVQVVHNFRQQGWSSITHMTNSIELLPLKSTQISLGPREMRVYRDVSLSYTPERSTKLMTATSILLCPN